MPDIANNVLKPPLLDDFPLINLLVGIVSHQTGLVGLARPRLLIMHDAGNFVIVRPSQAPLMKIQVKGPLFLGRDQNRAVFLLVISDDQTHQDSAVAGKNVDPDRDLRCSGRPVGRGVHLRADGGAEPPYCLRP